MDIRHLGICLGDDLKRYKYSIITTCMVNIMTWLGKPANFKDVTEETNMEVERGLDLHKYFFKTSYSRNG